MTHTWIAIVTLSCFTTHNTTNINFTTQREKVHIHAKKKEKKGTLLLFHTNLTRITMHANALSSSSPKV
jgi:hypothetical protein